jgi:hypothetical protein
MRSAMVSSRTGVVPEATLGDAGSLLILHACCEFIIVAKKCLTRPQRFAPTVEQSAALFSWRHTALQIHGGMRTKLQTQ